MTTPIKTADMREKILKLEAGEKIANALLLLGKEKRSAAEMRASILGLEAAILALPSHYEYGDAGAPLITTHHYSPGIYMRELFIPKGLVITGRIHRTEHLNILSQGKITVWTEDGMKTLSASAVISSQPGMKRIGYAHEDSTWITIHQNPSDEREIEKIEARLFAATFDEVFGILENEKESVCRLG